MANEREITIKLAAKNLTATEFAKARAEILGLEQSATKTRDAGDKIGPSFSSSMALVATGATIAVGAVAAFGAGLSALSSRGSDVADVHAQFDVLNRSIGNTGATLLGTLRVAMRGTISDFELMKSTNIALSQGLKLSESQFDLTAKAARVLADRTGGDTAEAYRTLTQVMASGQDKQLKTIGLNIDAAAAAEAHARSLGVQVGALSEAEKITATRNATLAEMQRVLSESGEAEMDFADVVSAGTSALSNFVDGLGEGIATSPVLTAAIAPIGDAIVKAFGGTSAGLIQTIVGWLETGALAFVTLADAGLGAADSVVRAFFAVEARLASAAAAAREMVAALPFASDESKRLAEEMRRHANESAAAAEGSNRFSASVGAMREGLQGARAAMLKAREEQALAAATGKTHQSAVEAVSVSLDRQTVSTTRQTDAQKLATKEAKDAAAAAAKLDEEIRKFSAQSDGVQAMFAKGMLGPFETELRDTTSLLSRSTAETAALRAESQQWAEVNGATLAPSIAMVGTALGDVSGVAAGFKASLTNAMRDLPNVIMSAVQGGGNVGKSIGASLFGNLFSAESGLTAKITEGAKKMLGEGIGGAIGAVVPGLGTLLGTQLGALADKAFGKLFKREGRQVNDMRDDFVAAAGGIHELNVKAQAAGLTLDRLLKAKNVKDYQAAVEELNRAMGQQGADMELARQAMDEWGISASEAGQKFAQADMDKTAGDMLAKLKAATNAGVDLNAIISKGGDDFGKMVHQAIRSGTTISNEFRPVLAAMIANKTLVDENGEAFTDLSEIPFAQDIGAGIADMATSLKELVAFFHSGVTGAFTKAADVGVDFANRVTSSIQAIPRDIRVEVNGEYNPPSIDGAAPGYRTGTKERHGRFFVDFGQGTTARLHGHEAVITPSQAPDFVAEYLSRMGSVGAAAPQAASPNVYVLVEVDSAGRKKTESVISEREYLRREMNQLIRTSALAGAVA